MSVLVTGAAGFLGTAVADRLAGGGAAVIGTRRSGDFCFDGTTVGLDLADRDHCRMLRDVIGTVETVVHLAGRIEIALEANPGDPCARPVPGHADLHRLYRDNVVATANVVECALAVGARHLVFASSQAVYGFPTEDLLSEDSDCRPLEHYAATKLCCEQMLHVAGRQGLGVTMLRFPGLFSEDRAGGVVRRFVSSALTRGAIEVDARLPLPFDVVHRTDVVAAIGRAVERPASGCRVVNIGTGEPCSLELLADAVAELVPGCRVRKGSIPQPIVHLDISRARRDLGWTPQPRRDRLASLVAVVHAG